MALLGGRLSGVGLDAFVGEGGEHCGSGGVGRWEISSSWQIVVEGLRNLLLLLRGGQKFNRDVVMVLGGSSGRLSLCMHA